MEQDARIHHRRSWIVGLALGGALFAVGSVPHLVAAGLEGRGTFTGVVGYNWQDTMIHLGWIKAYQHGIAIANVFACGREKPFMVNAEFGLGGFIARFLGGNVVAAWHFLRLVGLLALGSAIAFAVARYVPRERRPIALALASVPATLALVNHAIGDAFPSTLAYVNATPIEGNTVAMAFEMPQMSLASALVVVGVLAIDDYWRRRGAGWPWGVIAVVDALWLLHPFEFWTVGVVFAAAVAQLVWRGEAARGTVGRAVASAAMMAAPLGVYLAADWFSDGEYRRQYALHSGGWPTPIDLAVALGAPGVLAVLVATGRLPSTGDARQERLLATWLLGTLLGIYLPFAPFRWHLINGLQVATAILAARARLWDCVLVTARRRRIACAGVIAAGVMAQLPYLWRIGHEVSAGGAPAFRTPDMEAALVALRGSSGERDCVLSSGILGLDVTLHSDAHPFYLGHRLNLDWPRRQPASMRFLAGVMSDAEARSLVDSDGITHVLCDASSDGMCSRDRLARIGFTPAALSPTVSLFVRAIPTASSPSSPPP